jgi:phage shock protein A
MRLFRRVGDIVAANLNDLVDRFEDPEVMLRQAIREMEATIESATGATARAIAHERCLDRERADHDRRAGLWRARAEGAVADGDDDLARHALARTHEHEALSDALAEQWSTARRAGDDLRRQVEAMKAKHAEARRKLASLSARRRTSEAFRAARGAGLAPAGRDGFSRYARLREDIELAEAQAEALAELQEGPDDRWTAQAEDKARGRRVESELDEIKARLRRRGGPDEAKILD